MTDELKKAINEAKTLAEVEDIYRPYKQKRRTRATIAKEKGLEPLALTIYMHCLEEGYDVLKEPIPVVPAQHYHMGGVKADLAGRTSMQGLYAVGEAGCNGVHGKNRLASNSLLESLVFAQRAADDIVYGSKHTGCDVNNVDMSIYSDIDALFKKYKEIVMNVVRTGKEHTAVA